MKCKFCGSVIKEGFVECPSCGSSVGKKEQKVQTETAGKLNVIENNINYEDKKSEPSADKKSVSKQNEKNLISGIVEENTNYNEAHEKISNVSGTKNKKTEPIKFSKNLIIGSVLSLLIMGVFSNWNLDFWMPGVSLLWFACRFIVNIIRFAKKIEKTASSFLFVCDIIFIIIHAVLLSY